MPQDSFIGARVNPALAESFALACRIDATTVSAALRRLITAYIESVAALPAQGGQHENGADALAERRPLAMPIDRSNDPAGPTQEQEPHGG